MLPLLLTPIALSSTTCSGADPAITNVTTSQSATGDLSTYTLKVTVANLGSRDQAKNALVSVDIFVDGAKKDEKGLPPLAAGATYSFDYDVHRATDAGERTTKVNLRLVMDEPSGASAEDCSLLNDRRRIVF